MTQLGLLGSKRAFEVLKEKNLPLGSRLEITLLDGADFNNGMGPAPTVDPHGFNGPESQTDKPGAKFIGYLSSIEKDRLFIHMGYDPEFSGKKFTIRHPTGPEINDWYYSGSNQYFYFHRKAIHSISLLKTVDSF
jgi:hypothetical protein